MTDTPTPAATVPVFDCDGHDVMTVPAQLSPAEATAKLAEMKTAYDQRNGMGSPEAVRARLAQLRADPTWRDRVLAGGDNSAQVNELAMLSQMAGNAGAEYGFLETVDGVSDPNAQSSLARAALIDQLDMPPDTRAYFDNMEAGQPVERPSEGDGIIAKRMLDKLSKSKAWADGVLSNDPETMKVFRALNRLKAWAQPDGRPVSPEVAEWMRSKGL
jgi:hypothetical protein